MDHPIDLKYSDWHKPQNKITTDMFLVFVLLYLFVKFIQNVSNIYIFPYHSFIFFLKLNNFIF